jgi:hypothetical protein
MCGRNVVFPPEKRQELAKCRACNFEFIPSLPSDIIQQYTPMPMGPPKPPAPRDPEAPIQIPHKFFLLSCPLEVWLVMLTLVANGVLSLENVFFVDTPVPDRLITKFYGLTLSGYANMLGLIGVLDLVLSAFLFQRSDWAYFVTLARCGFGTLFGAAMLIMGETAPVVAVFPLVMMILSLSRAGGRY